MGPGCQSYKEHPVHGHIVRRKEVGGFVLSETEYDPELSIPLHVHEKVGYFCLVLQGSYTERSVRHCHELHQATLICHIPLETHSDKFHKEKTRLFCAWFGSQWVDGLRTHAKVLNESAYFTRGPAIQLASKLYKEFWRMDAVSSLAIEGLMLEMMAATARDAQDEIQYSDPPWIHRTKEILHARFNESLSVSRIAEEVGVHPAHLTRVFRRCFGCAVGDYVRRLRIEFVCHELSTSHKSLVEIAILAGFCDQGHLSRTFKQWTGLTPREYRSAFRTH